MGYLIDAIFILREVILLTFIVISSPLGIIAGLLLLNNSSL